MKTKIVVNKARCKKCDTVIESKHRHDFKWCKCESVAVDGGHDYLRRCGNREDWEELSVAEEVKELSFKEFVDKYAGWDKGRDNVLAAVKAKNDHDLRVGTYEVADGVKFYVLPKGKKSRPHRIMVICPSCGKHLSAGRIHQHAKARIHKEGK
jgi:hypothetical protein